MCSFGGLLSPSARLEQFYRRASEQIRRVCFLHFYQIYRQFSRLSQKDIKYAHILLELLKVFPEELQNRSIRIGDNRRNAVQQELAAQIEPMLAFLVSLEIFSSTTYFRFRNTSVKAIPSATCKLKHSQLSVPGCPTNNARVNLSPKAPSYVPCS